MARTHNFHHFDDDISTASDNEHIDQNREANERNEPPNDMQNNNLNNIDNNEVVNNAVNRAEIPDVIVDRNVGNQSSKFLYFWLTINMMLSLFVIVPVLYMCVYKITIVEENGVILN